ncbi:hypothetical protein HMPREF1564_2820 [Providencia alcalifaciens R90-1475]|nr:hypothetical protein HMPREF1564_2820 [Providencia alcalifaciens R90-1475]
MVNRHFAVSDNSVSIEFVRVFAKFSMATYAVSESIKGMVSG